MKTIANVLGVARSHLHERVHRPTAARGSYCKAADEELLPLIRRLVDERPTYGYRRVTALVNRVLAAEGQPAANHKRVFRIMKRHGLLLQRHTGRRKGRLHDGKVVVMRSNLRWCSDVFEITCWNGEIVRIVFVIDAHDREVLAWHAVAGVGVSGSMVRCTKSSTRASNFARVSEMFRCLGPDASAVMNGRLISVWAEDDSSILAFSAASLRR